MHKHSFPNNEISLSPEKKFSLKKERKYALKDMHNQERPHVDGLLEVNMKKCILNIHFPKRKMPNDNSS